MQIFIGFEVLFGPLWFVAVTPPTQPVSSRRRSQRKRNCIKMHRKKNFVVKKRLSIGRLCFSGTSGFQPNQERSQKAKTGDTHEVLSFAYVTRLHWHQFSFLAYNFDYFAPTSNFVCRQGAFLCHKQGQLSPQRRQVFGDTHPPYLEYIAIKCKLMEFSRVFCFRILK